MKQEEKSRRSREEILEAAIKEFAVYGYETSSINRICQANQISKGKLYHHFENKDGLFLACTHYCYEKLTQASHPPEFDTIDTFEKKCHILFFSRQMLMVQNPYYAPFMWNTLNCPPPHLKQDVSREWKAFRSFLSQLLDTALAEESWYNPDQLYLYVEMFFIASNRVHTISMREWDVTMPLDDRMQLIGRSIGIFDQLIHIFLYGVVPRSGNNTQAQ